MLNKLYPVLLSITVALAIGVYLRPGEARVWIQQANQWGSELLHDALRATSALAEDDRSAGPRAGYASTGPAAVANPFPSTSQDPSWTYVADAGGPTATLAAPVSPSNGYSQNVASLPDRANTTQPSTNQATTYPRVLATGSDYVQSPYQNQPASASGGVGQQGDPSYSQSYATPRENPLRADMPSQSPWDATVANGAAGDPAGNGYSGSQPTSPLHTGYPKVQWAGDWRDYHGVPETAKPTEQSQYGYLPPPDINSTTATVDRYLPNRQVAQTPSQAQSQPSQPGQTGNLFAPPSLSPYPGPPVGTTALPPTQQQSAAPAANGTQQPPQGLQSPPYVPSQPYAGTTPPYRPQPNAAGVYAGPTQPTQQSPASRFGINVTPAKPFESLSKSTAQGTAPANAPVYPQPNPHQTAASAANPGTADRHAPTGTQIETPDPVAGTKLCEGAQQLAVMGSETILANELMPMINQKLSDVEGIEKASEEELTKAREHLVRQLLPQQIDLKLLYVDAKRNLPPEVITRITDQLGKGFEEEEISRRLKELNLGSRREYEQKLAQWGSSMEHEKRLFIESTIARQWMAQHINGQEVVTHEQMLDYYRAHVADYDHPTRVRWEHLEVKFDKHPDKREAWRLIATMGNAVQQGQPFAEVAKQQSEGLMASSGGQRDWLTAGSLKSEVLDQTLFSLPQGALSPILEDETGFHIVRVVEREDAYRTPFEDVQTEIRKKIEESRRQEKIEEFIVKLREQIPVWTIFDEATADTRATGAQPSGPF